LSGTQNYHPFYLELSQPSIHPNLTVLEATEATTITFNVQTNENMNSKTPLLFTSTTTITPLNSNVTNDESQSGSQNNPSVIVKEDSKTNEGVSSVEMTPASQPVSTTFKTQRTNSKFNELIPTLLSNSSLILNYTKELLLEKSAGKVGVIINKISTNPDQKYDSLVF